MFEMFCQSVSLFMKGKLFQDFHKVVMLAGVGALCAALLIVGLVLAGANLWIAVALGSLAAGSLQPRLFRDLKYR